MVGRKVRAFALTSAISAAIGVALRTPIAIAQTVKAARSTVLGEDHDRYLEWEQEPSAATGSSQEGNRVSRVPKESAPDSGAHPSLGPSNAPIVIVEYSNYFCGPCRTAEATMHKILERRPGEVKLVWMDYPISKSGWISAHAARCADHQGKFWAYHDLLMGVPISWITQIFLARAGEEVGLEPAAFDACMKSEDELAGITADVKQGTSKGVYATPTFFINGQKVVGAKDVSVFESVIDRVARR